MEIIARSVGLVGARSSLKTVARGIERSSDLAWYQQGFRGIQDGPFVCLARFLILHMYDAHFIRAAEYDVYIRVSAL